MATLSYATLPEYEGARGPAAGADKDRVTTLLLRASRAVDSHCGRRFYVDDATSARTYEIDDPDECAVVDDIATTVGLTVVDNDVTKVIGTDFYVEPTTGLGPTGEAWPISRLELIRGAWTTGLGPKLVVTAKWGWPTAPPDLVKEATILLVADLVTAKDNRFGTIGFGDGSVMRARANPLVTEMLQDYVRADVKIGIA